MQILQLRGNNILCRPRCLSVSTKTLVSTRISMNPEFSTWYSSTPCSSKNAKQKNGSLASSSALSKLASVLVHKKFTQLSIKLYLVDEIVEVASYGDYIKDKVDQILQESNRRRIAKCSSDNSISEGK